MITSPHASTENDVVIILDSDHESDVDYIPDDDSGTQESSESYPSVNSTVCQEHQDLLSEFVELTGREKCKSGSFLDEEQDLPWKTTVVKFIKERESEGYHFKTSDESLQELTNT